MIYSDLQTILWGVPSGLPALCIFTLPTFATRKQIRSVMEDLNYKLKVQQEMRDFRAQVEMESAAVGIPGLQPVPSVNSVYYTKRSAAKLLGISYRTIERWYMMGYINRVEIGGRIYFHRQELVRVSKLYNYGIAILASSASENTLNRLRNRMEDKPSIAFR